MGEARSTTMKYWYKVGDKTCWKDASWKGQLLILRETLKFT